MPALTDYLSRRGEVLVLVLVVVLSVALMFLSSGAKDATARALNDAVITPVQSTLTGVRDLSGLRAENDSLRARLARTELDIAALAERGRAAGRLEEILGFKERSRFEILAARIIAREAGRIGDGLKIDRGLQDGVRKNQAVVSIDGLVGRVAAVEPRSAYVRPLMGRHCRVSARVTRTRTQGVLTWSPEDGLLLAFLPVRAEVRRGDEIVSSGLGGVFPSGIPLGRVEEVETDAADGSLRVRVIPAARFGSLEEVFVVSGLRHPEDLDPADANPDRVAPPESALVADGSGA